MSKPFNHSKVPYFICTFSKPEIGRAIADYLATTYGFYKLLSVTKDFGNVDSTSSPASSRLYTGYGGCGARYSSVPHFCLDYDLIGFFRFLEDSQVVKEVKVNLTGGVVDAVVTKGSVGFMRTNGTGYHAVTFLNHEDLEIIREAQKQLS